MIKFNINSPISDNELPLWQGKPQIVAKFHWFLFAKRMLISSIVSVILIGLDLFLVPDKTYFLSTIGVSYFGVRLLSILLSYLQRLISLAYTDYVITSKRCFIQSRFLRSHITIFELSEIENYSYENVHNDLWNIHFRINAKPKALYINRFFNRLNFFRAPSNCFEFINEIESIKGLLPNDKKTSNGV